MLLIGAKGGWYIQNYNEIGQAFRWKNGCARFTFFIPLLVHEKSRNGEETYFYTRFQMLRNVQNSANYLCNVTKELI